MSIVATSLVEEASDENIVELKDENFNNEKSKNFNDELNRHFGPDRKSFQFRALSRKTLAYQKRQMFVNVCCITLCPLLMVAISGIMGIVINQLINGSTDVKDYLFCSNVSAVDGSGFFLQPNSDALPKVPYSSIRSSTPNDNSEVLLTNYYVPPPGDELFAPLGSPQSCVYWFGKNYPFRQPYEPQPSINDSLRKDTTYKPDLPGGWFNASLLSFPANLSQLSQLQTFPHLLVRDAPGVDSGTKPQIPLLDNLTAVGNVNYSVPSEGSSGILGTFDTLYFANISGSGDQYSILNFMPVPYFEKLDLSDEDMDNQLTQRIQNFISKIAGVNKAAIAYNGSSQEKLGFFVGIAGIVAEMPWGNILFDAIDNTAKRWNYTLQIGDDPRVSAAASYPTAGFRRVAQQSQLSKGFLKTSNNAPNAVITTGYRIMPQSYSSRVHIAAGAFVGGILYPFGVSFLLPIFVITLVKEKEDRILIMMEMNGLKSFSYYLTHYLHFYSLHILTSLVFIITGLIFQMEFFTLTSPGVYILLFFFWGHIQIALAFLFTVFFSKSRTALVITFLLVLCGVIISLATDSLFKDKAPIAYYIWPPFAFYRGLSVVNTASVSKKVRPYRLSDLQGDDEVLRAIIAMIIEFFVVILLAFYLTQIVPSEYGVPKKWHFFITDLLKKKRKSKDGLKEDVPTTLEAGIPDVDPEETKFEDEDVKAERQRVLNNEYPEGSPLVMRRMRKVYPNGKLAVKDVTFAVEKSLIFGLLGPNGAGKTSLISILTGLYRPTSGSATLNQFDIHTDMDNVYMCMGVCPQHDILWGDLTVKEHLLFYARLKGIPAHLESQATQLALQQVRLEPFADRLSKGLSGGEKRRLSIAISLIGNPAVVFLDEPTTGLDPEVRRLIWNIIQEAKAGRTIVLTTHSMEEAEVLCNRIGIMAKGTLRCLGPQLRLKEVYGRGFKLSFTCRAKNVEKATAYIESLLPTTAKKLDSFVTNVSYEFESQPGLISMLFAEIEKNKKKNCIDDWGLSQTSLEEVFLRIIGESDAEAD